MDSYRIWWQYSKYVSRLHEGFACATQCMFALITANKRLALSLFWATLHKLCHGPNTDSKLMYRLAAYNE